VDKGNEIETTDEHEWARIRKRIFLATKEHKRAQKKNKPKNGSSAGWVCARF
jgi:hypothetical protein